MTALDDLRRRLTALPDPQLAPEPAVEHGIAASVRYLGSDAALRSLDADVYWPKWDSPWWHMLLLFEIGEARRIPERAVGKMIERLAAFPIKRFPIVPGELPPGANPYRDVLCHCALGSVVQILSACGRDVARELPWIEPEFGRCQMADGGLSCDDTAYRATDECPSSMVATIAPFEAMLRGRAIPAEHAAFVERAAGFLIERHLMLGSATRHNAEERVSQVAWQKPCFPRFYFYDVLRGLAALVRWAEIADRPVPLHAISGVVDHLLAKFPDGAIRRERLSYAGVGTWMFSPSGDWVRHTPAFRFPLLDATSALDQPCPFLTRQWSAARQGLLRLIERGRVADGDGSLAR
ncbi:MAG TPA: hypothetical protein VF469_12460 [Kofleriaceae bacterium]